MPTKYAMSETLNGYEFEGCGTSTYCATPTSVQAVDSIAPTVR